MKLLSDIEENLTSPSLQRYFTKSMLQPSDCPSLRPIDEEIIWNRTSDNRRFESIADKRLQMFRKIMVEDNYGNDQAYTKKLTELFTGGGSKKGGGDNSEIEGKESTPGDSNADANLE